MISRNVFTVLAGTGTAVTLTQWPGPTCPLSGDLEPVQGTPGSWREETTTRVSTSYRPRRRGWGTGSPSSARWARSPPQPPLPCPRPGGRPHFLTRLPSPASHSNTTWSVRSSGEGLLSRDTEQDHSSQKHHLQHLSEPRIQLESAQVWRQWDLWAVGGQYSPRARPHLGDWAGDQAWDWLLPLSQEQEEEGITERIKEYFRLGIWGWQDGNQLRRCFSCLPKSHLIIF